MNFGISKLDYVPTKCSDLYKTSTPKHIFSEMNDQHVLFSPKLSSLISYD